MAFSKGNKVPTPPLELMKKPYLTESTVTVHKRMSPYVFESRSGTFSEHPLYETFSLIRENCSTGLDAFGLYLPIYNQIIAVISKASNIILVNTIFIPFIVSLSMRSFYFALATFYEDCCGIHQHIVIRHFITLGGIVIRSLIDFSNSISVQTKFMFLHKLGLPPKDIQIRMIMLNAANTIKLYIVILDTFVTAL